MIDIDFKDLLNELEALKTPTDRYEFDLLIKILKSFVVYLDKINKYYLLREKILLEDFFDIIKKIKLSQKEISFSDMFVALINFFESRYKNIQIEYPNKRHLKLYYSIFKHELKFFLAQVLYKNDIYKDMIITKINSKLLSKYSYDNKYNEIDKINIETEII